MEKYGVLSLNYPRYSFISRALSESHAHGMLHEIHTKCDFPNYFRRFIEVTATLGGVQSEWTHKDLCLLCK